MMGNINNRSVVSRALSLTIPIPNDSQISPNKYTIPIKINKKSMSGLIKEVRAVKAKKIRIMAGAICLVEAEALSFSFSRGL